MTNAIAPDIRAAYAEDLRTAIIEQLGEQTYKQFGIERIILDYAAWNPLKPRTGLRTELVNGYITKEMFTKRLLMDIPDVKFPRKLHQIGCTIAQVKKNFKNRRFWLYSVANAQRWHAIMADLRVYSPARLQELVVDHTYLEQMLTDWNKKCKTDPLWGSEQLAVWEHGPEIIKQWTTQEADTSSTSSITTPSEATTPSVGTTRSSQPGLSYSDLELDDSLIYSQTQEVW